MRYYTTDTPGPLPRMSSTSVKMHTGIKMVDDNHIDRDCFELFIKEGVYLKYAQQLLDPVRVYTGDEQKYVS